MVGGAAVTDSWAKEIGGVYASDAMSAVVMAKQLLEKSR
jgi:methanogenic corrinoid protein MtbC1